MAGAKKPRIRKTETVREMTVKASAPKTEDGKKRGPISGIVMAVLRPLQFLKRPLGIILWPLRLLGRLLVPKYIKNSINELKQVNWPSRRHTWKLTFAVMIFATTFGFLVVITDYGLDKVIRRIVLR